eukprot:15472328-Alexandrium_andersonii.AAC.1
MPALKPLADPGDDARDLVIQDPEVLLLPQMRNGAVVGVRTGGPQLRLDELRRMLKTPEVIDGLVDVAQMP